MTIEARKTEQSIDGARTRVLEYRGKRDTTEPNLTRLSNPDIVILAFGQKVEGLETTSTDFVIARPTSEHTLSIEVARYGTAERQIPVTLTGEEINAAKLTTVFGEEIHHRETKPGDYPSPSQGQEYVPMASAA
jgi:hypothetical protein